MAILRNKPYPGINFVVDLGTGVVDGPEAGLSDVCFPDARLEVFEYRNGNDRELDARKIETITRYGNLILRRGVIGDLSWYQWWNEERNGGDTARTIRVSLLTEDRTATVLTWKFLRARPVNLRFSPLNALGTQPFEEILEIAFERLEME
jgi:phage tail-like protein